MGFRIEGMSAGMGMRCEGMGWEWEMVLREWGGNGNWFLILHECECGNGNWFFFAGWEWEQICLPAHNSSMESQ